MERSYSQHELLVDVGEMVDLYVERISLAVGWRGIGFCAAYSHPWGVRRDGTITRLADLVMVTRLAALLAVILAMLARSVRR